MGIPTRVAAYFALFTALCFFMSKESSFAKLNRQSQSINAVTIPATQKDQFSWEKIVPSEKLVWTDCYSDRQCARFKVPLDYFNPDDASAAIAMVRIHSAVPHNSSSYHGPILINPGGPGGSGVDTVLKRGEQLSIILGPEFDIIGFDPRGIARSIPRVSFFQTRAERELWNARGDSDAGRGSLNASADALARAWARGMVQGQLAGERDDGNLRFMNTDHTARDMLRIMQAHGRDKLQYWGFSYGSILGASFASMFPNHVERLVIDGVADSEAYFAGEFTNDLIDADKAWQSFAHGCVAAGPRGCAFYAPTAAEIMENVDKISESLRARPIPVRTSTSFGLVDYSFLRSLIFVSLYSPYAQFPVLAQALADLSLGNATTLYSMSAQPAFNCSCDPSEYQFESAVEAGSAVYCNDAKRISPEYEDLLADYQAMSKTSGWADMWAGLGAACVNWPDFPKKHFNGPFVANTSFPLLLVGNTADPVTPLWSAKKMSQGFAESVVLTQDSAGHSSISGPSLCTQKYIRAYFLEGKLPEPGTVCPVDLLPFPSNDSVYVNSNSEGDSQTVLSVADQNLLDAVRTLAETFEVPVRFPAGL